MATASSDIILVTGAGGFLGSHVVPLLRQLVPRGRVIAVTRATAPVTCGEGVEILRGDLRLASTWQRVPVDVSHIVHLAARIPWDRREADRASIVADNVLPVARLVELGAGWPSLRQVVYGSSVSVYGRSTRRVSETSPLRPSGAYGCAKLTGEVLLDLLRQRGIAVASLRFSSIFGAGQYPGTVLPLFVRRAREGTDLELFHPARLQDFIHVTDAARAVGAAFRKRANGVFNIGAGKSVTMLALARAVLAQFDARGASHIVRHEVQGNDDPGWRFDATRAAKELGFRPRLSLEAGLKRLAADLASRHQGDLS